jgi:tripartite-type tricarboxylate transporter receptor subunit TctC
MKISIVALVVFGAVVVSPPASAQYPARPVRLIVTLGAGGPADGAARALAEPLSQALGQPVVVENRPGADGAIGAETVRNSRPDGYTLLWGQASNVIGVPLTQKNPPYDPLMDFTPLSFVGRFTICLFAHPNVPARTLAELVEHARANPGKLTYATNSTTEAIIAARLSAVAGITMARVPYKGGTSAIPDLLAGRLQLGFMSASVGLPQAKTGKLRVLATLLPTRSPAAPEVPTVAEAGFPKATMTPWFGLFGPAKLPQEIIERLSREINAALNRPEVQAQFQRHAVQPEGSTPQALAAFLKQDLENWRQVIQEAAITLE